MAALLATSPIHAAAQEFASGSSPLLGGAPASAETAVTTAASGATSKKVIFDPQVQPAASSAPGWEYEPGQGPVNTRQPINWISGPYFKAGPNFVISSDILDTHDAGYSIVGGYRVPIGPAFGDRTFLDFGGSYMSAFGETTRFTDGTITTGASTARSSAPRLYPTCS